MSLISLFCVCQFNTFSQADKTRKLASIVRHISFLLSTTPLTKSTAVAAMHFIHIVATTLMAVGVIAGPITSRDNHNHNDDDHHGLKPICHNRLRTKTQNNGCVRYTRGFDVTGVLTEVDLTFPQIRSECDCIQACLDRPGTCANYVWKFSTRASVKSGHRTCTLYSQFNLPAQVVVEVDLNSTLNENVNAEEVLANGNNPQIGALVPRAFLDVNLNTVQDWDAVSGPVWVLANGEVQC